MVLFLSLFLPSGYPLGYYTDPLKVPHMVLFKLILVEVESFSDAPYGVSDVE